MKTRITLLFAAFLVSILAMMSFNSGGERKSAKLNILESIKKLSVIPTEFSPLYDTIHLLGDSYIEISLKEQVARVIMRNDSVHHFKISSGNGFIKKGKETPEGLFTVQSKYREAVSKQFDNAKLINWVGFNGNIGFHGLEGTGYYRTLGLRPSSHGCVRIGTEDGKKLFELIKVGTPVLVYKDNPARIIQFSEISQYKPNEDFMLKSMNRKSMNALNKRLRNLYESKGLQANLGRLFMDGRTSFLPGGYDLGFASRIAPRQFYPLKTSLMNQVLPDRLRTSPDYFMKKADSSSIATK